MKMNNLQALADMVILRFEEVVLDEKTKTGIILVNNNEKEKSFEFIVDAIGPEVPANCGFAVGDKIVANNHDLMYIDTGNDKANPKQEDQRAVTKYSSIWVKYS